MQKSNRPGRRAQTPGTGKAGNSAGRQRIPAAQAARNLTAPTGQGEDKRSDLPKKPQKRKNRWFVATLMVLATLAGALVLSVFILESLQDLFGLNQSDRWIDVTIPESASTVKEVADLLEQKGVISQSVTFQAYAWLKVRGGEPMRFLPGDYKFNANYGYDQLMLNMQTRNIKLEIVRVTLPEGLTALEIAKRLEESKVCGAQEFLDFLESGSFDYEFMDRMPDDPLRFRRMEGNLFPDTYDFYVGEAVPNVAMKFFDNFEKKITPELERQMLNIGLTLDETVILASIIQRESGDEQVYNVSAVFHNRLNNSAVFPRLESCATRDYVDIHIKPHIRYTNETMYDAYNTYVSEGLPAGPIGNPGLAAIRAALNPSEMRESFFVNDGWGEYYYAMTYDEHLANIRVARAASSNPNDAHGTGVRG